MPEAPLFYNVIFSTLIIFGWASPHRNGVRTGGTKFPPLRGNEENNWIRLIDLALYGKIIKYGTRVEFLNTFTAAFTHKRTPNPLPAAAQNTISASDLNPPDINSQVIVSFRV